MYISEQLHHSFKSMILLNDISDHLPIVTLLKQTKLLNKEPLTFKSRCLNANKLKKVNHQLMRKDWIGTLTGTTSNDKFNQSSDTVNEVLDDIALIRTVRISAKWWYIEPWMTKGLKSVAKTKLKLCRKSLEITSSDEDRKKYVTHRNIYNKLK